MVSKTGKKQINETYSDGESEDYLLELFKSTNSIRLAEIILANNPSWPLRYHLSSERENLLDWYEFEPKASLLEVGAGCGALTGLFCRKVARVVANELTEKRAEIIRQRCKNYQNLEVVTGNIDRYKTKEKFDYVTSVGVLEYSGKFIKKTKLTNPFRDFLKILNTFKKPKGILFIAIENKFGLKYWNGVREDHTGRFFDSLEGYPNDKSIQTFGREEISALLKEAGFKKWEFYYPLPDYKLPIEIFSDNYLPSMNHNIKPGMFPVTSYATSRHYLFNSKKVIDNIIKNKSFPFFANSFLILAI